MTAEIVKLEDRLSDKKYFAILIANYENSKQPLFLKLSDFHYQQLTGDFVNGSYVESLPPGDGTKIRGARYNMICLDEYAQKKNFLNNWLKILTQKLTHK